MINRRNCSTVEVSQDNKHALKELATKRKIKVRDLVDEIITAYLEKFQKPDYSPEEELQMIEAWGTDLTNS